jgi:hypothetical protein
VSSGARAETPNPAPTKTDFNLDGWYREAAYTTRWNFTGDTVTGDITLHAKWAEKTPSDQNKEALQEAGEITLTAKDNSGADVELAVTIGDGNVTVVVNGGAPIEYPSEITDSAIILKGAGSGDTDVSLGYVINDGGTLTITSGLDQIEGPNLSGAPVTSAPNDNLTKPEASGNFVAVTGITGVPSTGVAGTEVNLSGATVAPSNATNKTIVWTVKTTGGTGVTDAGIVNDKFTPTAAGTLTLTATIANGTAQGTNFTRDFDIIISPLDTFVAVTGITGVPTGGTAGAQVDLSAATVAPANANNKTIVWTVKSAGDTGVTTEGIVSDKFTPASAGTLTLTATIANGTAQGTAFVRDFEIIISAQGTFVAVTDVTGVPTEGTAGTEVSLSGATVAPSNANNKTIAWSVKTDGGTGVTTAGIVGGKFTPTAAGTLTLTATIANGTAQGTNYAKDFDIIISPVGTFVAVTGITGVPSGGTVGTEVNLSGATVAPSDATNKTIVWTVKLAGTTGVGDADIVEGKFTPENAGTLTLTATIANGEAQGTAFVRDFEIIISPVDIFVPVTNIIDVPDSGEVGNEVVLTTATVVPDNADNKTIVWTGQDPGATGLTTADIVDGKFTATAPGTVKLTATIADGKAEGEAFPKDFDIIISVPGSFVPVTSITGVPEEGTVGSLVSLGSATVVPGNATYKTIAWRVKTAGAGVSSITGNAFTPTEPGSLALEAVILSGGGNMTPYVQPFTITINPAFVPVSSINGLPAARNAVTGSVIDLNAGITVMPTGATNRDIVWSVKTAGDTGLTNDDVDTGVFTPTEAGTIALTATITNGLAQGSNYTQDITLTIIKPVERIDYVPLSGTKGFVVDLGWATPWPADASYQTIVWTVKEAGATGVTTPDIVDNKFTPTGNGTMKLTATIANGSAIGTAFVHDYTIEILDPGEVEIDFGLVDDTSILLRGNMGGTDQSQLSKDDPILITKNAVYYVSLITGGGGSYTDVVWYLNGNKQNISGTGSMIYLDTSAERTIKLAVIAKRGGLIEGSGMYTFVIEE